MYIFNAEISDNNWNTKDLDSENLQVTRKSTNKGQKIHY